MSKDGRFSNLMLLKVLSWKPSNYTNGLLSPGNIDLLGDCPPGPKSSFLKGTREMVYDSFSLGFDPKTFWLLVHTKLFECH